MDCPTSGLAVGPIPSSQLRWATLSLWSGPHSAVEASFPLSCTPLSWAFTAWCFGLHLLSGLRSSSDIWDSPFGERGSRSWQVSEFVDCELYRAPLTRLSKGNSAQDLSLSSTAESPPHPLSASYRPGWLHLRSEGTKGGDT